MKFRHATASTLLWAASFAAATADDFEFFEKQIRPALADHCYKCHSANSEKVKGGLLLDSREGWKKGGDSGPAIVPGKPDESLLIKAVRRLDKDLAMPPKKELPEAVVNAFVEWVKRGAPDPRTETSAVVAAALPAKAPIDYGAARKQWAYQKPTRPELPEVANAQWVRHPIDRFILAALEAKQMQPAAPADKRALLRRATFDLTGLPPTPEEVAGFVKDENPDAFARVVERLLASPHYGERWARHWLDVVRYADSLDSRGVGKDGDILDAWRYRDWVVNALNADLPYDQFITQQVAGDILAAEQWDRNKVIATGMYAIGNWGNGDADKEKLYTDIVDDQVDVTSRAFLGLTLACARCHDHKFDPLTNADYYSLAGMFFSSHILARFQSKGEGEKVMRIPLLSPEELAERESARKRLAEIEEKLAGGLQPLTEFQRDIHGKPGLHTRHLKGTEPPSVVMNTTDTEVKFTTVTLPARAIAVHPGSKIAVTAAWRSPLEGHVRISGKLRDADPNCGNGIDWSVRHGAHILRSGAMENGAQVEIAEMEIDVAKGELVRLVVGPRGEYSCDSTEADFVVRGPDGTTWDLRETLTKDAAQSNGGDWLICSGDGAQLEDAQSGRGALMAEREQLAALLANVEFAHGLQEGGIPATSYEGFHDARIHVRGRYDRLGEICQRALPVLLAGEDQPQLGKGSGRLALARWLASPNNPLTARVMVNRVWQHHFGEGIVRTPNNFGKLGSPPTHPELLDWLASEFVRGGWSLKAMHRAIMLSATYQQSAAASRETLRADPDNLLFSRMNRRRLESEAVRDSLLAAAGTLDRTIGGPSVRELEKPRRTLYIMTIRSDRATYQSLFDAADPTGIVEKRVDSTVAPQALFFMNHPFVLAQAAALGERLDKECSGSDAARIDWLYRRLFARPADSDEIAIGLAALARAEVAADPRGAWEQYCQVLLSSNEFIYLE